MNMHEWAKRWGVPPHAVHELSVMLGTHSEHQTAGATPRSEADVQNRVRLEMTKAGGRFFRNNVGAYCPESGGMVRYGLANDTAAMNKKLKSSDLIGIRPIVVTEAHVGRTIGQFVAREVKREDWKYSGDAHEAAQLAFINLINSYGGDARFAWREGTV